MTPQNESWNEYRLLVIKVLEEYKLDIEELKDSVNDLNKELAIIKTRWSIIAAVIGFVASLIPILLQYILRMV